MNIEQNNMVIPNGDSEEDITVKESVLTSTSFRYISVVHIPAA